MTKRIIISFIGALIATPIVFHGMSDVDDPSGDLGLRIFVFIGIIFLASIPNWDSESKKDRKRVLHRENIISFIIGLFSILALSAIFIFNSAAANESPEIKEQAIKAIFIFFIFFVFMPISITILRQICWRKYVKFI